MKSAILITGASRGIGRELAISFAKRKYPLILTCNTNENLLIKLSEELEEYDIPLYLFSGDLSESNTTNVLYNEIDYAIKHDLFPNMPSTIINNAGVSYTGLMQDLDLIEVNHLINTNLRAPYLICQKFIPNMISSKNGLIVNISSIWGKFGSSCEVLYSATKAGLEGMTKALSLELEPSNIEVIAFRPGFVKSDMTRGYSEEDLAEIRKDLVDNKEATCSQVSEYIASIVSNKNYNTGDIIDIPYGWFKDLKCN